MTLHGSQGGDPEGGFQSDRRSAEKQAESIARIRRGLRRSGLPRRSRVVMFGHCSEGSTGPPTRSFRSGNGFDCLAKLIRWTYFNPATIVVTIVMPTSVHLPEPLLKAVDLKARALRISRNQLVVRALEREVRELSDWSPGFFEQLAECDPETSKTVDDLVRHVRRARSSKPPRQF